MMDIVYALLQPAAAVSAAAACVYPQPHQCEPSNLERGYAQHEILSFIGFCSMW
jgi:hypothetical protein